VRVRRSPRCRPLRKENHTGENTTKTDVRIGQPSGAEVVQQVFESGVLIAALLPNATQNARLMFRGAGTISAANAFAAASPHLTPASFSVGLQERVFNRLRFLLKSSAMSRRQKLDRDDAIQANVAGFPNLARASRREAQRPHTARVCRRRRAA
jgi:hypothetical protein